MAFPPSALITDRDRYKLALYTICPKKAKSRQEKLNSTPFVRQYGILETSGVLFYAKGDTKQEIHGGIQARSRRDNASGKTEPYGSSTAIWYNSA